MPLVPQVETIVRRRMSDQGAGHGFDHVLRVLNTARQIQSDVGGDLETIELAALLHDIGDAKFHDGIERSGEFSREILSALNADESLTDSVAHIVDNLSFRKRGEAEALTLEGRIVQDADRLDALGAIGIVRTIEYGAVFQQPFHVSRPSDPSQKTGIGHFHEKLFKLRDLMNTDAAKQIALQREQFMRSFLEQFLEECGES